MIGVGVNCWGRNARLAPLAFLLFAGSRPLSSQYILQEVDVLAMGFLWGRHDIFLLTVLPTSFLLQVEVPYYFLFEIISFTDCGPLPRSSIVGRSSSGRGTFLPISTSRPSESKKFTRSRDDSSASYAFVSIPE